MYLSAEKLGSGALLAPMAGVADRAMRELCMGFGAIGCIGEMASSKGISMNDRKTSELLSLSEAERPAGVQIFGDVPEIMAKSIETCMKYSPDFIDINMGCPAPKVAGNGGGSALMKRPELAAEIVARCVEVSPVPITVKMRAGWDEDSINAPELAVLCEQAGAAAITVHGRTRKQMYAPPVDLGVIAEVKRRVGIPVIGNGDISDGKSAAEMFEKTRCDGIMVGRGALGRPWVFGQINEFLNSGTVLPDPPVKERMDIMLRHISALIANKGDYIGIREARKHSSWYVRDLRGAAAFRREQSRKLRSARSDSKKSYRINRRIKWKPPKSFLLSGGSQTPISYIPFRAYYTDHNYYNTEAIIQSTYLMILLKISDKKTKVTVRGIGREL